LGDSNEAAIPIPAADFAVKFFYNPPRRECAFDGFGRRGERMRTNVLFGKRKLSRRKPRLPPRMISTGIETKKHKEEC
jgi:hypothetical protein